MLIEFKIQFQLDESMEMSEVELFKTPATETLIPVPIGFEVVVQISGLKKTYFLC